MAQDYDLAAYIWPAYHDEPRWRQFMSAGEGEWETIRSAQPRFAGHRQPRGPLWGYEDESDPQVQARKIDAAADHGINVFIFDWYWFDNQPFLEETLNQGFLQAPNRDRLQFYLMWANHDARTLWDKARSHENEVIWPGAVDRHQFTEVAERMIARYFQQPGYYCIDGCPVLAIYDLANLLDGLGGIAATREALDDFRARARANGLPGVHFQGILRGRVGHDVSGVDSGAAPEQAYSKLGLDSVTWYQWCHVAKPHGDYARWGEEAWARCHEMMAALPLPAYPHVSIGWDNNPRFTSFRANMVTGESPTLFGDFLERALSLVDKRGVQPPLVTINAWNEWSEASYLEPDTYWGMGYLEAVREVLRQHERARS